MSDIVIYALAAVGGFVLAWVIYGILIVIQTLRDFRWRKRIARAHEPRPFRKPLAPPDNPSNRSA